MHWSFIAPLPGLVANRAHFIAKKFSFVTTEKAVVKTITQLVTATGKVQPEVEVKISPEVAGEIIELPFKEGAVGQERATCS
jgi:multidrug efflux pump subunit AcrA (membrane-fusion protein)